jgi:hypothetical protein
MSSNNHIRLPIPKRFDGFFAQARRGMGKPNNKHCGIELGGETGGVISRQNWRGIEDNTLVSIVDVS